jgi:hypothetical protein
MKWKTKWPGLLSWIKVTVTFLLQARATALFASGIWGGLLAGENWNKLFFIIIIIVIIITKKRL